MYRADFTADLPCSIQPKQVVFYAMGLKIYGLLPYLLSRRVGGEFRSNETAGMIFPSFEPNYTMVRYGLSAEAAGALLDWLYADAGFQWGIAELWNAHWLYGNNAFNTPPTVFHLACAQQREGFSTIVQRTSADSADVLIQMKQTRGQD